MLIKNRVAFAIIALAFALSELSGQSADAALSPTVSQKQDMAIFGLGTYGYPIPLEVLGRVDLDIQKVFVDLGRFNVIGYQQKLSSADLPAFEDAIKQSKQGSVVIPDKYQFGETLLTQAEWNRLVGAFIVAVPVVGGFDSQYNQKTLRWEASITVDVTFLDVASGGSVLGQAHVVSSGSSKSNQFQSISGAVGGIAAQLTFEIRKIDAFQIRSKVLEVSGGTIKLQLGRNMGIQKGDEYAVVEKSMVEGFRDDRETGLIVIKDVGSEVSTGRIVYNQGRVTKDMQLSEIPRLGVEATPFFHVLTGTQLTVMNPDGSIMGGGGTAGSNYMLGFRAVLSRGVYDSRPFAEVEIPLNGIRNILTAFAIPIDVLVGGEYNMSIGRLSLTPYAAVGGSYVYLTEILSGYSTDTSNTWLFHFGGQVNLAASFLVTRDLKVYAEGGGEYWLTTVPVLYSNYGGISIGGGFTWKL
ncbi:MAG TPA: hypothetical protein VMV83_04270 [Rectinemataceae bacterium]|nr:hypothetical protein [Rectinemataceae bacterium]